MEKNVVKPLKALRRYGFPLTYMQRKIMAEERERGAVPTDTDRSDGVLMSRHFVARDGKTYTAHAWIYPDGSTYSSDAPAELLSSPNASVRQPDSQTARQTPITYS